MTELEQLDLGAECEMLWGAMISENLSRAETDRYSRSDYKEKIAALNSVPIADRTAYLLSAAFKLHQEDIDSARREMNHIDAYSDDEASMIVTFGRRPWGKRRNIIAAVAAQSSVRFGRRVTERTVETAWDHFRKFQHKVDDPSPWSV